MLTIILLAGRGVWLLADMASTLAITHEDIKAIRADTKGLAERIDAIDRWRAHVDERLKISGELQDKSKGNL